MSLKIQNVSNLHDAHVIVKHDCTILQVDGHNSAVYFAGSKQLYVTTSFIVPSVQKIMDKFTRELKPGIPANKMNQEWMDSI